MPAEHRGQADDLASALATAAEGNGAELRDSALRVAQRALEGACVKEA